MNTSSELLYLYCVSGKSPGFKQTQENDKPFFVYHQDLYAVVSSVSGAQFSGKNLEKNLKDPEWLKRHILMHEQVIEAAMKNSCVVACKFATLFNSAENIRNMLDERHSALKETLKRLEGRQEWGVKVYRGSAKARACACLDKEILRLDREIASASPGKAFILGKKRENLLENVMKARTAAYSREIFDRLKESSFLARVNKLLPKGATGKTDDMILNAAFLIDDRNVKAFAGAVNALETRHKSDGLSFALTGPWPPYNFCESAEKDRRI